MTIQLTTDLYSNRKSTVRQDGGIWRFEVAAHGAAEAKPADVAAQLVERITKEVVATAEAAKPAKGMPAQGMQLLRLLKDADRDIERARTALEQAQAKLAEIQQERSTALRDTPEGEILDRVAALDARVLRTRAVADQLSQDLASKQRARQQMLPSFKTDMGLTVGTCLRKERDEALKAQAEAYAALEKAMEPHLLAIAQAQAKLMALEGSATFPAIQARLEEQLLAPATIPVPTASGKQPELAAAS